LTRSPDSCIFGYPVQFPGLGVYMAAAVGQPCADMPQTIVGIVMTPDADVDCDCGEDLDDLGALITCMAGSDGPIAGGCGRARFHQADRDGDHDVDLADDASFQIAGTDADK
jgi:hypothetical protein